MKSTRNSRSVRVRIIVHHVCWVMIFLMIEKKFLYDISKRTSGERDWEKFTSLTREGPQRMPSVQRSIPKDVESEPTDLSSQTKTQPEWIARRSSVSNRRATIGKIPRETAWKMVWASRGDLTRSLLQVGLCMISKGEWIEGQAAPKSTWDFYI